MSRNYVEEILENRALIMSVEDDEEVMNFVEVCPLSEALEKTDAADIKDNFLASINHWLRAIKTLEAYKFMDDGTYKDDHVFTRDNLTLKDFIFYVGEFFDRDETLENIISNLKNNVIVGLYHMNGIMIDGGVVSTYVILMK